MHILINPYLIFHPNNPKSNFHFHPEHIEFKVRTFVQCSKACKYCYVVDHAYTIIRNAHQKSTISLYSTLNNHKHTQKKNNKMQANLPHSHDYRWHTDCQFTNERKNETNKQIKSRKRNKFLYSSTQ